MFWLRGLLLGGLVAGLIYLATTYVNAVRTAERCRAITAQRNVAIARVHDLEGKLRKAEERDRRKADRELAAVRHNLQQCILNKPTAKALHRYK